MIDQLRIGDKYSYDDFGASVAERKIGKPKKKTIKETVPHSNITYDFSRINGEIYWEERELQYILELDAETPEELEDLKIDLSNWLMNVFEEELYDPFIEDYHFKATYEDIDFDDSEVIKTTATVKFKAYPYMIANKPTKHAIAIGDIGKTVNEDGNISVADLHSLIGNNINKFHFMNPLILSDNNDPSIKYTFNGVIFITTNAFPSYLSFYYEGKIYTVNVNSGAVVNVIENSLVIDENEAYIVRELMVDKWGYFSLDNSIQIPYGDDFISLEGEVFVDKYSPTKANTTIYNNGKKYVCDRDAQVVVEIADVSVNDFSIIINNRSGHKITPTIRATTPVTILKGDLSISIPEYVEISNDILSLEPGNNVLSVVPSQVPDMLDFVAPGQVTVSYVEEVM